MDDLMAGAKGSLKEPLRDSRVSVFISYSWDSEEHKEWVLGLADDLANNGVYVIFDQYDLRVGNSMTHFMESALQKADKVLIIMTKNYKLKADKRHSGVGFEYSIVTQELFKNQSSNEKFIPILREHPVDDSTPVFLGTLVYHDMCGDGNYKRNLEELLRTLFNEHAVKRPALGSRPDFARRESTSPYLIDHDANLILCRMKSYACWQFTLVDFLTDVDEPSTFRLITEHLFVDSETKLLLPYVINNEYKVSHHQGITFERPLRTLYANWFKAEKLMIDSGRIVYEFGEYTEDTKIFLDLEDPFLSLFFLLLTCRDIYGSQSIPSNFHLIAKFQSNASAYLLLQRSAFALQTGFDELYSIPERKTVKKIPITSLDIVSMPGLYQKLYDLFVSDKPKSSIPFPKLDIAQFVHRMDKWS